MREYLVYTPPGLTGKDIPLVLVYHGGGKHARSAIKLTGFSALADREGFLVVYPEGIHEHWNDGRGTTPAEQKGIDDVLFTAGLLDRLESQYPLDARRVYAAGMSNGAMLLHKLAMALPGRIAAIAPVAGGMASRLAIPGALERRVRVIQFQGKDDRLAPYSGGTMPTRLSGELRPFAEAARIWAKLNGCAPAPEVAEAHAPDPRDGTSFEAEIFSNAGGPAVVSISIHGGGHTWPGGPQYLPVEQVGRASRAIDASAAAWAFFEQSRYNG